MNAMRELRESVLHTPEVLEAPARPLRRLPGYRSGMDWVRQRHALLKEAVPLGPRADGPLRADRRSPAVFCACNP